MTPKQKEWYEKNKERILAKAKSRRESDPEWAKAKYLKELEWRAKNAEEYMAYQRQWAKDYRNENIEYCRQREAAWREENRSRANETSYRWRAKNVEAVKAASVARWMRLRQEPEAYEKHKAERREYRRQWANLNREKLKLKRRDAYHADIEKARALKNESRKRSKTFKASRTRYYSDPIIRIIHGLRTVVRRAVTNARSSKADRTMALIGCTPNELRAHLESQFQSGMTWQNYGKKADQWSIDHIQPCSSFKLWEPEEQRRCFNWNNLRPMWFSDNCSKNSNHDGVKHWYQEAPKSPCIHNKPA